MPLVDAKCTNCGATLVVDSAKDAAICEFCGSAFIVEKAINYYSYSVTNHNQITADVVNVYNTSSSDFIIRSGRLLEYRGASVNAVVPEGVTAIGENAFSGLDMLRSVTIPIGVEIIERGAFSNCTRLSHISIPNTVIRIDERAFENCKQLSSISIPDSVPQIPANTFEGCDNLHHVSYRYIEENPHAFRGTPLYYERWNRGWECQFCNHINPEKEKWCLSCGFENIGSSDDFV